MPDSNTTRFQILALDGGGIKGLFSAAILADLESDLGVEIADHFDLITGTSTGGIIALGLGLGMRPREIVQFYVREGPKIFGDAFRWRSLRRYWRNKFSPEPLITALKGCFGERRLGDSRKRLVIPSFNLDRDDVYLFKTPHHIRLTRDWREPMWKVALATGAAPTYFPACCEVDSIRLIDGGMWANNPSMVGITEAVSMFGVPLESIAVLSLGTTNPANERPKGLGQGGMFQWRAAGIDVALQGQSVGAQAQACHLLGADRAVRVNPTVAADVFRLDKLSESRLLSEAASASRQFSPTFTKTFQPHFAPAYSPLQPVMTSPPAAAVGSCS